MTTVEAGAATTIGAAATTTGLPGEVPVAVRLPTTILITIPTVPQVREAAINTAHLAAEVALRQTFEAAEVVDAAAGTRTSRESPCWFETLAPTSPIRISSWHLDALVTSAMCTSRGTTTRSKRKVLPSSSTRIPIVSKYAVPDLYRITMVLTLLSLVSVF